MSETKGWDISLSKETVEHRSAGMRTSCVMHPRFTVYSKSEEGARKQVRRIIGPDGDGFKFHIRASAVEG